jgi:hypothetical protein
VAAGLGENALAGIDQNDGELSGGAAGCHVARILLMARRVGDDEFALVGGEGAIGHVDGDALFAFGGKAIDEKGEIELASLCADALGIAFQGGELVLEEHFRFVEKPADERRFAVIDAAAGDEAEKVFGFLGTQVGFDRQGRFGAPEHQK